MADEKTTPEIKEETTPKKPSAPYFAAHGRRKEATARIRLFKGKGENLVNGTPIEKYYPQAISKEKWMKPFKVTQTEGQYYATIKVSGSGKHSQVDAIVHGLARALILANPEFRTSLKQVGLLTRDPRVRERRKYGRAQKARKGKQSPKR